MAYEYEFEDLYYDAGYGELGGVLQVTVEPIFQDECYAAYNSNGDLQTYGEYRTLGGAEIIEATFYAYGNNGEELGEYSFETLAELTRHFGITELDLIKRLDNENLED